MDKLRIEWHRTFDEPGDGFMELNCDTFFPCVQQKAQKLFPLIKRWCSDNVIAELEQYLVEKEQFCRAELKRLANLATNYPAKSKECRKYTAEFKSVKADAERYKKNIAALQKGSD